MSTIYHEQGFDEDKYFGIQVDCSVCDGKGWIEKVEPTHHPQCSGDCRFCPIPERYMDECWECYGRGWIVVDGVHDNKDYQA